MITRTLLNKLAQEAANPQSNMLPTDIAEVSIDISLPIADRKLQYLRQIQNPYRIRAGQIQIHIKYAPDGLSINELLSGYFQQKI